MNKKQRERADARMVARLDAAKQEGYRYVFPVGDVVCAIHPQATTFGLMVDIDPLDLGRGYERRYCYESLDDAMVAAANYLDATKHPSGPWIKCKGAYQGHEVDLLNPELFKIEKDGPTTRLAPRKVSEVTFADVLTGRTVREFEERMKAES